MKGGGHRETWTVGMLARLRELHAAGLTFGQICQRLNAEFGTVVTRNACVGKGRRLGLPARKARRCDSAEATPASHCGQDRAPPRQGREADRATAADLRSGAGTGDGRRRMR